jgi:hypothetical protein
VIVALQGCVIVALQGCIIVALQGFVLQDCVALLMPSGLPSNWTKDGTPTTPKPTTTK